MSDQPAPRATLPERAQVVVIGGGAIGTASPTTSPSSESATSSCSSGSSSPPAPPGTPPGSITSAGMPTATFQWMSRYTTALLPQLTERRPGRTPGSGRSATCTWRRRPSGSRRSPARRCSRKAYGIPVEMVGPEEVARHWPEAKVDDILAAAWVPDEGRANPADVTQAYAKAARMAGATILEGVTVTGIIASGGRVTGVETDAGADRVRDRGERRRHVGPPGRRARRRERAAPGRRALLPDHRAARRGRTRTCRSSRTPTATATTARRPAASSSACSSPRRRRGRSTASRRTSGSPCCRPTGSGWAGSCPTRWTASRACTRPASRPSSAARSRSRPTTDRSLGEAPELRGFFAACGLNSLGILLSGGVGSLVAQWIVDGRAADGRHGDLARPDDAVHGEPLRSARPARRSCWGPCSATRRSPRGGPGTRATSAARCCTTGSSTHGADFMVLPATRSRSGSPTPGVSHERPRTWGRDQAFDGRRVEHRAVREAVGVMDMSFMAKILVQGPGALALLEPGERQPASTCRSGKIVYTQWLTPKAGSGPTSRSRGSARTRSWSSAPT